jgi:hypothetical protein
MAERTVFVDDLDGDTEGVTTVEFALDGTNYEIDLNPQNKARLHDSLADFVAAARKVSGRVGRGMTQAPSRTSSAPRGYVDKEQLTAIRDWARRNGLKVSDRGRIAAEIATAYNADDPTLAAKYMVNASVPAGV